MLTIDKTTLRLLGIGKCPRPPVNYNIPTLTSARKGGLQYPLLRLLPGRLPSRLAALTVWGKPCIVLFSASKRARIFILRMLIMSRTCDICGKHTVTGNKVSHAKNHTRRTWKPNIKKIKTEIDGTTVTLKICARCLKSDFITRKISVKA
jgi:large subunit ribosomal protein L28